MSYLTGISTSAVNCCMERATVDRHEPNWQQEMFADYLIRLISGTAMLQRIETKIK